MQEDWLSVEKDLLEKGDGGGSCEGLFLNDPLPLGLRGCRVGAQGDISALVETQEGDSITVPSRWASPSMHPEPA